MTLVKIGVNYINPLQVVRIAPAFDDDMVVVYLSTNVKINVTNQTLEEVVAKINEAL